MTVVPFFGDAPGPAIRSSDPCLVRTAVRFFSGRDQLGLVSLPGRVLAQTFDGFDDDRLYQDTNGNLFRRRGGQYVPYNGRVSNGRPVPDAEGDLDAEAYARRRAQRYGEQPAAEAPNQTPRQQQAGYPVPPQEPDNGPIDYTRAYAAITNEPFPVAAIPYKKFNQTYLRQEVDFRTTEPPGTIVVDPKAHFLYFVLPNGRARRYGVGVGKQGFSWSGTATINSKQAWPDWYPPKEMIARRPDLASQVDKLQSGLGVPVAAATRSAPAPCICGRTTRTRCSASTARWSRNRSERACPPVASE